MKTITHPSGFTLYVDSLHVTTSYGGVLEGPIPSEDVYRSLRSRLDRMWGKDRPYLLAGIDPDRLPERLPEHFAALWLMSFKPLTAGDGSQLVLAWFTDTAIPTREEVERVVHGTDWPTYARDFDF